MSRRNRLRSTRASSKAARSLRGGRATQEAVCRQLATRDCVSALATEPPAPARPLRASLNRCSVGTRLAVASHGGGLMRSRPILVVEDDQATRELVRMTLEDAGYAVRELEVLRLLTLGLGLKEIAERLVISPKTVGTHTEHIFLKLGVQTRAQAVAFAYRQGLVGSASATSQAPTSDRWVAAAEDPIS